MGERRYRALVVRAGGNASQEVLHLLRGDAEASLCGIARSALGPSPGDVEVVCDECIDWLKTGRISGDFPKVIRRDA